METPYPKVVSSWSESSVSFRQVTGPAAASRRSSAYWSRVEAGCDILNPVKYLCNVSPKSVGEVLKAWGSHFQDSLVGHWISLFKGKSELKRRFQVDRHGGKDVSF